VKNKSQLSQMSSLQEQCQLLEVRCLDQKNKHSAELLSVGQSHQLELDSIDARIRNLLRSKDDIIQQLQARLAESEDTSTQMENLLRELDGR
jgi:predicted RNase H-like nuclease (RuvC/YqgF family)